jgi:hypothetical protein
MFGFFSFFAGISVLAYEEGQRGDYRINLLRWEGCVRCDGRIAGACNRDK